MTLGLMNQHLLETLPLVCLLGVNASTRCGRYLPIFRRLCTVAIWCNCVRGMCVDCVLVAVDAVNTHPTHIITPNSNRAEPPEVTPETRSGIDSPNKLRKTYQVGTDALIKHRHFTQQCSACYVTVLKLGSCTNSTKNVILHISPPLYVLRVPSI
jgi:hypothetical protein